VRSDEGIRILFVALRVIVWVIFGILEFREHAGQDLQA
jgi:hypothetical protein